MTGNNLASTIKARRKLIRDDAACTMCRLRWADCKAERKRNPDGLFGCCDRCRHVPSPAALTALLKEIESGTVRTVDEVLRPRVEREQRRAASLAERKAAGVPESLRTIADLYGQGEFWRSQDVGWVRISEMSGSHRANLAAWLIRHAGVIAWRVGHAELTSLGEAPDEVFASWEYEDKQRADAPERWMRSTPLFKAVTKGIRS